MTLKNLTLLLVGGLLIGTSLAAQETTTPKREAQVEGRARNQQKRIGQGVSSGQLTPKETQQLEKREGKINKDIAKAEADGKITKKEQKHINQEENAASKQIHHKKHNAKTQPK